MARTVVESALIVAGLVLIAFPAQAGTPSADAANLLGAKPKKSADDQEAEKAKASEADKADEKKETGEGTKAAETESDSDKAKDKTAKEGKESAAQEDASDPSLVEQPHKTQYWLGARGRGVVIPSFMFGMFGAKGGKTVLSPQAGLELGIRRNGFEYDLWLTYARYQIGDTTFKASGDPENAWEIVSAKLNTITIGADFWWSHKFNDRTQLVYGIGAGLSVVFGPLYRTQAYKQGNDYQKCTAQGQPGTLVAGTNDAYCGADNDHYNGYTEPSWANGGQKPLILPWISPFMIGVRVKPHASVALRAEVGVAMPGPFFFGISGQYGLPTQ